MDQLQFNTFHSKILLFGEHAVVYGSKALAIPFDQLKFRFVFSDIDSNSKKHLNDFVIAFKKLTELKFKYNIHKFEKDLAIGLDIESNIPIGYGAGSSGAFVAAFFDHYAIKENCEPVELRIELGKIESIFHGNSSGIDPLVSFLHRAILLDNNGIELPNQFKHSEKLYLINSGISRSTEEYVQKFKLLLNQVEFKMKIQNELALYNNEAITAYLQNSILNDSFQKISQFQFEYMSDFIPQSIYNIWHKGLESEEYFIKLCGAGGGGYFLLYGNPSNISFPILSIE